MDALCADCGVYDAYYQCNSCNKKFCIDDWDKVHYKNSHQKLKIILPINEKSRKILIDLFESIKDELSNDFNHFKQKIIKNYPKTLRINIKTSWISSLCNVTITYLMKIKYVKKKILYIPIEYFLINPEILAEKYAKSFHFQNSFLYFYNFFMYNYFHLDSKILYGLSFDPASKYFNPLISEILDEYLKYRRYKLAYEFLNNLREFSLYLSWFELEIHDEITIIQNFIANLIDQDFNVDLTLWDKVENEISKKDYKYYLIIFYIAFQRIFHILKNRKYFVKCSKSLLQLGRNHSTFLSYIYDKISCYYLDEWNIEKCQKYLFKSYHALVKHGNLIINNESNTIFAFKILWKLYDNCNALYAKFKRFLKKYGQISAKTMTLSCFFIGRAMLKCEKYDFALDLFKKLIILSKKTKLIDNFLMGYIHFYLGKIFIEKDNYQAATKEIYKAKEIFEKRLTKDNEVVVEMNITLGHIYSNQHWYDESLKYYNLAKESLTNLGENNIWLRCIDYHIGRTYFGKGDYTRALTILETCLYESSIKTSTSALIIIHTILSMIHYGFGNIEKTNYHIENSIKLFESYEGSYSWSGSCIQFINEALIKQKKYKLCEEVCRKCLDCKENQNKNVMLAINLCLLRNYEYQEDYKKADSVLEYLKLNLVHFNNKEGWNHQLNVLIHIGELFHCRNNFEEAEIYFKKAEEILERYLRTYVDKKADVYLWLGSNYFSLERLEESESYLLKALDIYINNFFWTTGILKIYFYLGYLYLLKNDFPRQKHYHWEFIRLCEEKKIYACYLKVGALLLYHCIKLNDESTAKECYLHLREYYKENLPGLEFTLDIGNGKNGDKIKVHFDTRI